MIELTAHSDHRGTRAIQRMVECAPSTGGLALWVKHQDLPADIDAPPVATDGTTVFYGASFESVPFRVQVGLIAHEVLHIGLRHPQRFLELQQLLGDVDLQLFNICADAIVNSTLEHLSWIQLPASAVLLDQLLAHALLLKQDVGKALLEWDVERLYRAIDDRRMLRQNGTRQTGSLRQRGTPTANAGSGEQSPDQATSNWHRPEARHQDGPRSSRVRQLGGRSCADLMPNPETQGPPEAEAEQAREWSERILRGHAGDGDFSMLRVLIADLPRSRTPWEQVLRTQLAKGLARKPDISWSRPARSYIANQGRLGPNHRLPWEPGTSTAKRVPRLALIVDVSGSIENKLMDRFACEIEFDHPPTRGWSRPHHRRYVRAAGRVFRAGPLRPARDFIPRGRRHGFHAPAGGGSQAPPGHCRGSDRPRRSSPFPPALAGDLGGPGSLYERRAAVRAEAGPELRDGAATPAVRA